MTVQGRSKRLRLGTSSTVAEPVASPKGRHWKRAVKGVLANGGMEMVFQPICRLEPRRVVGVEALARFAPDAKLGHQTPDRWFAAAHRIGKGPELETLAVSCALLGLLHIPQGNYISVNVSATTLVDPEFAPLVLGSYPSQVVVELTEHDVIESLEAVREVLFDVRGRGTAVGIHVGPNLARLSIDDVGAGHSGLARIAWLEPDFLKLDRSLVEGVDTVPLKARMVAGMVLIAGDDMTLVAEGIETETELDALVALGVQYGQGYYLGRPMPIPGVAACEGLK